MSRELYKDINPAFVAEWKAKTGETVTVNQSHGGSSKQALAVADGLDADVDHHEPGARHRHPGRREAVWSPPIGASAFRTTPRPTRRPRCSSCARAIPKGIKDWDDLVKPGVQVIVPNPKTSGNGRYTYLAAWGYALRRRATKPTRKDFVAKLFANVPVLDGGGRGATTTFTQRDVGDVLVTFENEALAIAPSLGADKFDIVYPSLSIDASAARRRRREGGRTRRARASSATPTWSSCTRRRARRSSPSTPSGRATRQVLQKYAGRFPAVKTFNVEQALGSWAEVQAKHFADGAHLRSDRGEALMAHVRAHRVLPGFGLSLGFTLAYLSLIVLIPLAAVFLKTADAVVRRLLGRR